MKKKIFFFLLRLYKRTRDRMSKRFSSHKARRTKHWGKPTWDALFLLASDYPHAQDCADDDAIPASLAQERRRAWKKMLEAMPGVLTCGVCSYHFERYMERRNGVPFERALDDRESLFKWLHQAKDEVNRRAGRKSISLAETKRKYIPKCDNHRR